MKLTFKDSTVIILKTGSYDYEKHKYRYTETTE